MADIGICSGYYNRHTSNIQLVACSIRDAHTSWCMATLSRLGNDDAGLRPQVAQREGQRLADILLHHSYRRGYHGVVDARDTRCGGSYTLRCHRLCVVRHIDGDTRLTSMGHTPLCQAPWSRGVIRYLSYALLHYENFDYLCNCIYALSLPPLGGGGKSEQHRAPRKLTA